MLSIWLLWILLGCWLFTVVCLLCCLGFVCVGAVRFICTNVVWCLLCIVLLMLCVFVVIGVLNDCWYCVWCWFVLDIIVPEWICLFTSLLFTGCYDLLWLICCWLLCNSVVCVGFNDLRFAAICLAWLVSCCMKLSICCLLPCLLRRYWLWFTFCFVWYYLVCYLVCVCLFDYIALLL